MAATMLAQSGYEVAGVTGRAAEMKEYLTSLRCPIMIADV